jgi:hypothetical protein
MEKNQSQHGRKYCYRRLRSPYCSQNYSFFIILEDLLDFGRFDYDDWRKGEIQILQPQLESMGYSNIQWRPGETDSFGPLTRICRAIWPNRNVVWFIYG